MFLLDRLAVSPALFHSASPGSRQHFAWTQSTVGIKGGAQPIHRIQIVVGEKFVHEFDLFDANAMLAGYAAATGNTLFQNFGAGGQYALNLGAISLIE